MVKILRVGDRLYAYDAKSRFLSEISLPELRLIHGYHHNENPGLPDYIHKIIEGKIFSPGHAEKIVPAEAEIPGIVDFELSNYIPRKFALEITEKCTLRCRYCFYTNEEENKRKHTSERMDEKTAFDAIDYYYSKYESIVSQIPDPGRAEVFQTHSPVLSWWGGEPLLDFDLIKKTKDYMASRDWEKLGCKKEGIAYSIVTNLTVMNEEIMAFLVANDIHLMVSLDGGEKQHDKNRVFPDGSGSFQCVFENLNALIDAYPQYAKNKVSIQSVLADNIDEEKALSFIGEYFKMHRPEQSILSWNYTSERHEGEFLARDHDNSDLNEDIQRYREKFTQLEKLGKEGIAGRILYNKGLYKELYELVSLEDQFLCDNPGGNLGISRTFSCPLGSDTLFVARNGEFHFCCKADQSLPLGNIDTGIDPEKVESAYASYFDKIDGQCKSCWAVNFCKICPALLCWDKEFKLPSEDECGRIRKTMEKKLLKWIVLSTEFEQLHETLNSIVSERIRQFKYDSKPTTLTKILNA